MSKNTFRPTSGVLEQLCFKISNIQNEFIMKKVIDAFGLFYNKNLLGTNCVPLNMPPTTVRHEVQKKLEFFHKHNCDTT